MDIFFHPSKIKIRHGGHTNNANIKSYESPDWSAECTDWSLSIIVMRQT